MKSFQLIGFAGAVILIIAAFVPLAEIGNDIITMFPIYDNAQAGAGIWVWKDISAFAVTYIITLLLSFFFIFKRWKAGALIVTSLNLAAAVFIYVAFWMTSVKAANYANMHFSYSINGLLILVGLTMLYYSGAKTVKKENKNK